MPLLNFHRKLGYPPPQNLRQLVCESEHGNVRMVLEICLPPTPAVRLPFMCRLQKAKSLARARPFQTHMNCQRTEVRRRVRAVITTVLAPLSSRLLLRARRGGLNFAQLSRTSIIANTIRLCLDRKCGERLHATGSRIGSCVNAGRLPASYRLKTVRFYS
jgi:hypothetical protein